jgi:hypothetical protein
MTPQKFWHSLTTLICDCSNLGPDVSQHITCLDELMEVLDTLIEMRNHTCAVYWSIQGNMRKRFKLLAEEMETRMTKVKEYADRSNPNLTEEIMDGLLALGIETMSEAENNLLIRERTLGKMDSMINHIDAARKECFDRFNYFHGLLDDRITWHPSTPIFGMSLPARSPCSWVTEHILGFPRMIALASFITNEKWQAPKPTHSTGASFARFLKLPPELRVMVYKAIFPGPRLVTPNSSPLDLSTASSEARRVVRSKYSPTLNPAFHCPYPNLTTTYVDIETDIVFKNLLIEEPDWESYSQRSWQEIHWQTRTSLFELGDVLFKQRCLRRFTGLSKVKHLAVVVHFWETDCPALFPILQVCCPVLQSLTICASEMGGQKELSRLYKLRLIDIDSNVIDYAWFQTSQILDNMVKKFMRSQLQREIVQLANWKRYLRKEYSDFREKYGIKWTPTLRIRSLARMNRDGGWHYLDREVGYGIFVGDNGLDYTGFLESLCLTDNKGNFLSRYDGIERLLSEGED